MSPVNQVEHAAGLAYREAVPAGEQQGVVLAVHGWPQSSYSWRPLLAAVAEAGWRGVAPDLQGFGDSPSDSPHTWERQVEALERLCTARSTLGPRRPRGPRLGRPHRAALGLRPPRSSPAPW